MIVFRQLRSPVYPPHHHELQVHHHEHGESRNEPYRQGEIDLLDLFRHEQGEINQQARQEDVGYRGINEFVKVALFVGLDISGEVYDMNQER